MVSKNSRIQFRVDEVVVASERRAGSVTTVGGVAKVVCEPAPTMYP